MVQSDMTYVKRILGSGLVTSPCLELGVGYGGADCRDILQKQGITYYGTDMVPGKGVDFVVNFEDTLDGPGTLVQAGGFGSILALNVLEHTFDPIRVLDNIFLLLRPRGVCVIIVPSVWPLHNYPHDCWRINPDFFEEYCRRRSLRLLEEHFEYVGVGPVRDYRGNDGELQLPPPSGSPAKMLFSRLVHRLFNTSGRGMRFPAHVATGVVIQK